LRSSPPEKTQSPPIEDFLEMLVPNPFVNVDWSMLDNFTAAREYSRNSVSVGRIDESHVQEASGVTISKHFAISRPGVLRPLPYGMLRLVFDAVLDIHTSKNNA